MNCIPIKVEYGVKGDRGAGITSVVMNDDYTLTLTFEDGSTYITPPVRGETGNGISSAVLNADYTLTLTFTDGNSYTSPSIRGATGYAPQKGVDYWTADDVDEMVSDTKAEVVPLITSETQARTAADNAINNNLSTINGKIPEQASSTNQLADKDFVNSSITTNTAFFKGTFNVTDLGLTYSATHAQVAAALQEEITTVTNNDYSFVYFVNPTTSLTERYDRYKYSSESEEWAYELTLNNSSFTAAQWAAISSGITGEDVQTIRTALQPSALNDYYTKQQSDNKFAHSDNVQHETWVFTLDNGTTVTKEVVTWISQG